MLNILRKRRSIRRFTDQKISSDHLEVIKESVLRSPSSRGFNPWEFVFVDDRELLDRLSRCKEHGAGFLAGAALGVVVLGDENKTDVWIEDCSIASFVLHAVADSLGIGSCWIQVRNRKTASGESAEKVVQEILEAPDHMRVEAIVGMGHPAEQKKAHPRESLQDEKIYLNGYNKK